MSTEDNLRPLEAGIHTDLEGRMTYGGYLQLGRLLDAQKPVSSPPHHDEMLFIVQHQVSELWMKLLIHELGAALEDLRADRLAPCQKIFARCKQVLRQLTEMWSVLETLTPSEYMEFREILGPSSGFQSLQYRTIEFLLGNKNAAMLRVLARRGHAVPAHHLDRDWSQPHVFSPELVPVFERIYENTKDHWEAYHLCEDLVDLESQFQLWRFRHMRTVMRIIGFKKGTGGSSGVGFLKQALELTFFPELFEVRTTIGLPARPQPAA